jgi:hypothetical protein
MHGFGRIIVRRKPTILQPIKALKVIIFFMAIIHASLKTLFMPFDFAFDMYGHTGMQA